MADGKVVIDVILDDGKVAKGVANIDKRLGGVAVAGKRAASGIKEIATALGLVQLASKAINMVKSALDGAISRYDTLTNFPRVLQTMGFDADESQKAIKRLAKGIEGLPTTLDSVAKTTQRIALMTGDLDRSVDITLALNNAFLASGASSADAARGLEQFVQMLSTGTVDLQSWRTLQETMPVALNKTAEAFGYAGASAQRDLYNALKEGNITFDEFTSKLIELNEGVGGFAEMARKSTTGIATSWQNVKTAVVKGVADVIAAIDEALGGPGSIAGMFDYLKAGINAFFSWVTSQVPKIATVFSGVKDAISPWLPAIQTIVEQIRMIIMDRISVAIEFVKGLFASFKQFWNENGQEILNNAIIFFTGVWETVQTVFNAIYSIVQDVLNSKVIPFIQSQLESLRQLWQENGEQIMQAVQNAFKFIQSVVQFVMPIVKFIIEIAWSAIKDIITGALNVIKGAIQVFTAIFTGDWSQLWEGIKSILKGAVDLILGIMSLQFLGGIKNVFTNLLKNGVNIVRNLWTTIINFFKGLSENATNIVMNMVKGIVNFFRNLYVSVHTIFTAIRSTGATIWGAIRQTIVEIVKIIFSIVKDNFTKMWNVIRTIFTNVRTFISTIWSAIRTIFSNFLGLIKNLVTGNFRGMLQNVRNIMNSVLSVIRSIWNRAIKFLKGINLKNIGKDIIRGLINGIGSMASAVADKVRSIGNSIKNGFKKVLGIASPSKIMRDEVGRWIPAGIAEGIEKEERSAIQAMRKLGESLSATITPSVNVSGSLRGANLPVNLVPTVAMASGGYVQGGMTGGMLSTERFYSLVSAILEMAKRPVSIQVNGREFIYATVDDFDEILKFQQSRRERFRRGG